ncbi:MAG: ABC transporter ATP-binding protein [Candidatus Aenigmatarchaeota archaeon]
MKPIIQMKDVDKIYDLESVKIDALKDVNLSIAKGEFVAIMGASGSGKSTLLHIMGLLDKPSNGSVILDGINASELGDDELAELRGKKIGFVFQFFNLYPTLTARQNVELPLSIQGYGSEKIKKSKELLKNVGLAGREDHMPSQLSGGERQRIAIARALAVEPDIILADEPTGNLDSKTGKELIAMLTKINESGRTVVIITHDVNIASHAGRTIQIKDGRIISDNRKKRR